MHAYLFAGGETQIRENEMLKFAKKSGGEVYEFTLQKIADVRNLADFTKYSQEKAISILIKDIDTATNEALNAFLKNLEEPGKNISYFLTCDNEYAVLPTILSRCQIKRLGRSSENSETDTVTEFLNMSVGQKFKTFDLIKKRDEAKKYLQTLILSAHKKMLQKNEVSENLAVLIKTAQNTNFNLNLNANVNLQMTCFAINSTKTRFT